MKDVLFFHTADGGDIHVDGAGMRLCNGLQTAVYLSLFGGNDEDEGRADGVGSWWGNTLEASSDSRIRPQTQEILQGLPLTTRNIARLQAAVEADTRWMTEGGYVSEVAADVVASGVNRVEISVRVTLATGSEEFKFSEIWETG